MKTYLVRVTDDQRAELLDAVHGRLKETQEKVNRLQVLAKAVHTADEEIEPTDEAIRRRRCELPETLSGVPPEGFPITRGICGHVKPGSKGTMICSLDAEHEGDHTWEHSKVSPTGEQWK